MFGLKEKLTYDAYIEVVAQLSESCYNLSKTLIDKFDIANKSDLLQALDYTRLFLAADLASAWFSFEQFAREKFRNSLFARFYKIYPKDFLSDLSNSIKSDETKLGDICNFLVMNFSHESSFDRLNVLEYTQSSLQTSLRFFSALFRTTKVRNEFYITNYAKMAKWLDNNRGN